MLEHDLVLSMIRLYAEEIQESWVHSRMVIFVQLKGLMIDTKDLCSCLLKNIEGGLLDNKHVWGITLMLECSVVCETS